MNKQIPSRPLQIFLSIVRVAGTVLLISLLGAQWAYHALERSGQSDWIPNPGYLPPEKRPNSTSVSHPYTEMWRPVPSVHVRRNDQPLPGTHVYRRGNYLLICLPYAKDPCVEGYLIQPRIKLFMCQPGVPPFWELPPQPYGENIVFPKGGLEQFDEPIPVAVSDIPYDPQVRFGPREVRFLSVAESPSKSNRITVTWEDPNFISSFAVPHYKVQPPTMREITDRWLSEALTTFSTVNPIFTFLHKDEVNCLLFSKEGKIIISGSEFSNQNPPVRAWNIQTGKYLWMISSPCVLPLSLAPNNQTLVSGIYYYNNTRRKSGIQLWNLDTHRRDLFFSLGERSPNSVAISPNGKYVVCGGVSSNNSKDPNVINLWDIKTGRLLSTQPYDGSGILYFTPDGRVLTDGVHIWRVNKGRLRLSTELRFHDWVGSNAISPNGKILACLGANNEPEAMYCLSIWNLQIGKIIKLIPLKFGEFSNIQFFSNALFAVIHDYPGKMPNFDQHTYAIELRSISDFRLIKVLAREPMQKFAENPIKSYVFSPDHTLLATGNSDGTVKIWKIR